MPWGNLLWMKQPNICKHVHTNIYITKLDLPFNSKKRALSKQYTIEKNTKPSAKYGLPMFELLDNGVP